MKPVITLALFIAVLMCGCVARERIPRYPTTTAEESLRLIAERSTAIQTVTAESTITLTRPDGVSVVLDGAVVMRMPAESRIRAWKFGRAILDLTLTPDGTWLLTHDDPSQKSRIDSAAAHTDELARVWSLLAGRYFSEPLTVTSETAARIVTRRHATGEPAIVCQIDRPTLTPRAYEVIDEQNLTRFRLTLDRYRQIDGFAWPMRMTAVSAGGTISIEHRSVELNASLAGGAFIPPRRAEKLK